MCPTITIAEMEWQLLQVLNLCTVLLLGILLAKVLGLFVYAFWARRGLIAFCFAESLYLSFQDNDTQFIWGHTPLAVQIYIYVFILGFICSWRLTPVGITGTSKPFSRADAQLQLSRPGPCASTSISYEHVCRRNSVRQVYGVICASGVGLPLD